MLVIVRDERKGALTRDEREDTADVVISIQQDGVYVVKNPVEGFDIVVLTAQGEAAMSASKAEEQTQLRKRTDDPASTVEERLRRSFASSTSTEPDETGQSGGSAYGSF